MSRPFWRRFGNMAALLQRTFHARLGVKTGLCFAQTGYRWAAANYGQFSWRREIGDTSRREGQTNGSPTQGRLRVKRNHLGEPAPLASCSAGDQRNVWTEGTNGSPTQESAASQPRQASSTRD